MKANDYGGSGSEAGRIIKSLPKSLIDPITMVPPEMFGQFIYFLKPSAIAQSNAVCSKWRTAINSNPSLHTQFDLSKLGRKSSTDQSLLHFNRLSALSAHKPVKITLNLASFWKKNSTSRKSISKPRKDLFSALQQSNSTLKEVSITIDSSQRDFQDSTPFILGSTRELSTFQQLERIKIKAPSVVEIWSGREYSNLMEEMMDEVVIFGLKVFMLMNSSHYDLTFTT